MTHVRFDLVAVLAGLALATGCAAAQLHRENDLAESIRLFNDGVRWERFAAAATAIPPAQRAQFVDDMDQLAGDLKITDYDIVKVDPRGEREAQVQVKLSWYKASEGTLHETHALQTWERHGQTWWMVDETRLRGAEMPGLTDSSRSAPSTGHGSTGSAGPDERGGSGGSAGPDGSR
ncbi:MAG TPA: hypothetical protein VFT22_41680 [Kofleriaceae bacterium]|nr:hypothetical protein [Kofleriaceae bacterium]